MRSIPLAVSLLLLSSTAAAERPRGGYEWADPDLVEIQEPSSHQSNIIYLNGCFNAGDCTFTPGNESSIANRSSIIRQTANLTAWDAGPTAWDAMVECVRKAYTPFNIEITDQDPGNTPHFEAVVAGYPNEAGMPNGVAGVAPFACGVINNAITYSFANIYSGNIPEICWTVAQESAHAFGLDHELLCEDPMTYLNHCGPVKWFRDVDAECGEDRARPCSCGGYTQNSYREIRDHFGPGTATPPVVSISAPREGESLQKGYAIRAEAADDIEVSRVELWINSRQVAEVTAPPYVFNAPMTVADGRHRIEVKAFDLYGASSTALVHAVQGEPCSSADSCPGGDTCVDGRCVPGPGTPGGLGESCGSNEDCSSGLCGDTGEGAKYCAEQCEVGAQGCPDGFGCLDTGNFGVCWPGHDDGSGGCQIGGGSGALSTLLLGLLAALGLAGRRRRRV